MQSSCYLDLYAQSEALDPGPRLTFILISFNFIERRPFYDEQLTA